MDKKVRLIGPRTKRPRGKTQVGLIGGYHDPHTEAVGHLPLRDREVMIITVHDGTQSWPPVFRTVRSRSA